MVRMTSLTAAASSGELGGDATGTRLIVGPDAAAKREGAGVSKRNRFGSRPGKKRHRARGRRTLR